MIVKSYEIENKLKNHNNINFFLLYGENFGLKKDIKKLIISENKKKNFDTEIISLDEEEIFNSKENFFNLIYSGSLFSKHKILVLNRVTDKITETLNDILIKTNDTIIILFAELLDKKSKLRNLSEKNNNIFCIPCYQDNFRDLEKIIKMEIKDSNINISNESLNFLIERSDGDRNTLRNEINKIKSFALTNKKISFEQIKALTNSTVDTKLENMINSCLEGDIFEFKKKFSETFVESMNYILLIKIFSKKIERLIIIKKQKNNNIDSVINGLRPPVFWKEKPVLKKQLKIWDLKNLEDTIKQLNQVEVNCKKNNEISQIILLNFFIKICKRASNYS